MNSIAQFEDRASSRRSKHEGESSTALCDRLSRTRDTSQRQLPADQDYAVSTREYQTDQSSLKPAPAAAGPVLEKRQKQQQRQKQPHRCAAVDRVTPYQSGSMIAVPQRSVPHPCGFFLSQGWEAAIAGYSISVSGLAPAAHSDVDLVRAGSVRSLRTACIQPNAIVQVCIADVLDV